MVKFSLSKEQPIRLIATILFIISLIFNGVANTKLLGTNTVSEVAQTYTNLFMPAGITFSIWGIIYSLLILYCLRQFKINTTSNDMSANKIITKISPYFIVITLLNLVWIVAWQNNLILLSTLVIIAMLVILAIIYSIISKKKYSFLNWLSIKLPFSIYFGWITVAAIANVIVWLVSIKWNSIGLASNQIVWTIVMLIVSAMVCLLIGFKNKDWAYMSVFVWAYAGLLVKHLSAFGFNNGYPSVVATLIVLILIVSISAIFIAIKSVIDNRKSV